MKKATKQFIASAMTTVGAMSALVLPTLAYSTPEQIIKKVITSIGGIMTSIFSPLCVLILGIAIVSIILCKDSKGATNGISWAKRAVIGFVIFNCLGSILQYGTQLFAGQSYNFAAISLLPIF